MKPTLPVWNAIQLSLEVIKATVGTGKDIAPDMQVHLTCVPFGLLLRVPPYLAFLRCLGRLARASGPT